MYQFVLNDIIGGNGHKITGYMSTSAQVLSKSWIAIRVLEKKDC